MITKERFIEIHWTLKRNYFTHWNKNAINAEGYPRKVGSGVNAVKAMTSKSEEMRVLMPLILGFGASDKDGFGWEAAVAKYWNSLSVDIPSSGKRLNIGWNIDINDPSKKDAIKALIFQAKEEKKTIAGEEDLVDYLFGKRADGKPNMPEEYLFRYATPIVIEDYLLWRYCLNYNRVANDISLANKSENIDFYLYDESAEIQAREAQSKLVTQAITLYVDVLTKTEEEKNVILTVLNESIDVPMYQKDTVLKQYADTQPQLFISVVNDKNLIVKATIEKYITAGILKRYPNTQIVVDAEDSTVILGNTLNEVVTFFKNEVNKPIVNEYFAKYQALIQANK